MAKLKLAKKLATMFAWPIRSARRAFHGFDTWLKKAVLWPWRIMWRIKRLRRTILPIARFTRHHHRLTAGAFAGIMLLGIAIPMAENMFVAKRYQLSSAVQQVLGTANEHIASKIDYNPEAAAYEFNAEGKRSQGATPISQMQAQAGGNDAEAEQQYSVDVSRNLRDGVTYHENNLGLSFTLTPQFAVMAGQKTDQGRLLYPLADGSGGQLVYTATNKGLKEDIVLYEKPAHDTVTMRYGVNVPKSLDIKLLDDGSIGVYSADPALYGNIQYGSDQDKANVERVREQSEKTHLAFTIPAPYVVGLDDEGRQTRMPLSSRFVLSDDKTTLSVVTTGFDQTEDTQYPLSIDPSVTVTSTSDFADKGNDEDGNLKFGTDEVSRAELTGGRVDTPTIGTTTVLPSTFTDVNAVAYNGRMYVAAYNGSSMTFYTNTINSDGTLGSWVSSPNQPLQAHGAGSALVQYSGYVYLLGGTTALTTVEYSKIQANGSLGTWQTGSAFNSGRQGFGAVAYNNVLYAAGNSTTTEYAQIKADGSLGTWQVDNDTFAATVTQNGLVAHGGYLYAIGGRANGADAASMSAVIQTDGSISAWSVFPLPILSGPTMHFGRALVSGGYIYIGAGYGTETGEINYAPIQPDGEVWGWSTSSAFAVSEVLMRPGFVAYNGYLYGIGGELETTGGTATTRYAKIATAGDIDRWSTSTIAAGRTNAATVAYGGYLYILGGQTGAWSGGGTASATVQRALISNSDGTLGTWTQSSSTATGSFATAIRSFAAFAHDGYIYALGGTNAAGTTYTTTVQRSPIGSAGALGTWTTTGQTALPAGRQDHAVAVYNGRVYLTGGMSAAATYNNQTLIAPITSTGIGAWSTASNAFSSARRGHSMVQYGGYLYVLGGWTSGASTLSSVQYTKINADGTLGVWAAGESLFGAAGRAGHTAVAANGYIYVMGGVTNTTTPTFISSTIKARINPDGSLDLWTALGDMGGVTVNRAGHSAVAYKGYIYNSSGSNVAGTSQASVMRARINNGGTGNARSGWGSAAALTAAANLPYSLAYNGYMYVVGGVSSSVVQYAPFNESGGGLGTWTTTNPLPQARGFAAGALYNGRIYMMGGKTGAADTTSISTVVSAPINTNGSVGAWTSMTSLPVSTFVLGASAFAKDGYLYFIGGMNGTDSTVTATVRRIVINTDGTLAGAWSTTSALGTAVAGAGVAVVANYVYLVGGRDPSGTYDIVQYAQITAPGTLGTWAHTTSIMGARAYMTVGAANGYIYAVGGDTTGASANVNTTQYAPINANGTLGNWMHMSNLGTANSRTSGIMYKDRLYTAGGAAGTQTSVVYVTLDIQTRKARYGKLIDVGPYGGVTGISLTGTFVEGQTSISYRTADGGGTFSGSLNAANYINPSNTTALCTTAVGAGAAGRYVYVTVEIDDTTTMTYSDGESTTRAAIGSIVVDYAPPVRAPNELRMRGGKWFKTETLQSLDTCAPLTS